MRAARVFGRGARGVGRYVRGREDRDARDAVVPGEAAAVLRERQGGVTQRRGVQAVEVGEHDDDIDAVERGSDRGERVVVEANLHVSSSTTGTDRAVTASLSLMIGTVECQEFHGAIPDLSQVGARPNAPVTSTSGAKDVLA